MEEDDLPGPVADGMPEPVPDDRTGPEADNMPGPEADGMPEPVPDDRTGPEADNMPGPEADGMPEPEPDDRTEPEADGMPGPESGFDEEFDGNGRRKRLRQRRHQTPPDLPTLPPWTGNLVFDNEFPSSEANGGSSSGRLHPLPPWTGNLVFAKVVVPGPSKRNSYSEVPQRNETTSNEGSRPHDQPGIPSPAPPTINASAPPVVYSARPVVDSAPPVVHCAPPVVHCAPPVHRAPPVVHCAPPVVENIFSAQRLRALRRLRGGEVLERRAESGDEAPESSGGFLQRGGRAGEVLQSSLKEREHILELPKGGSRSRRHQEWWSGIRFSASAITGTPMHLLSDKDIHESIQFMGRCHNRSQRLCLESALQQWTVWPQVEEQMEDQVLAKIRSYFTAEMFAHLWIDPGLTQRALRAFKAVDEADFLHTGPVANICNEVQKFKAEAAIYGLGWERANGLTYGVMVNDLASWAKLMVLLYEKRSGETLHERVYFKLAVDASFHWTRGGQVCKVFLELLHDRGLLHRISVANFEGRDSEGEIVLQIGNSEAWPGGGHTLDQLKDLVQDGLSFENRRLDVHLFECHDLACTYPIVAGVENAPDCRIYCPWCTTSKSHSAAVTQEIPLACNDTIRSIGLRWHMQHSLVRELNEWIPEDSSVDSSIFMYLLNHNGAMPAIRVLRDWPMDRAIEMKITPAPMFHLAYCTRQASIRTVRKLMTHLEREAQQLDVNHPREDCCTRFEQLYNTLQAPPLRIDVKVDTKRYQDNVYGSLVYDQSDGVISDRLLCHMDLLLAVLDDFMPADRLREVRRMWSSYRRFNRLQEASIDMQQDMPPDESLPYVAKEFSWYASRSFPHFTPYIHIQIAHAAHIARSLPAGVTLGSLKNEAVETKHKEAKNSRASQGPGRRRQSGETRGTAESNRMDLEKEMLSQYLHVRMAHGDLLRRPVRKKVSIPREEKLYLKQRFCDQGFQDITKDEALALEAQFNGSPTFQQIAQAFRNWTHKARRIEAAGQDPSVHFRLTSRSHTRRRPREVTDVESELLVGTSSVRGRGRGRGRGQGRQGGGRGSSRTRQSRRRAPPVAD